MLKLLWYDDIRFRVLRRFERNIRIAISYDAITMMYNNINSGRKNSKDVYYHVKRQNGNIYDIVLS